MTEEYADLVNLWKKKMTGCKERLAQLQLEEGKCAVVTEYTVVKWDSQNLDPSVIREAYRLKVRQAA
jgi:hypothetical protein